MKGPSLRISRLVWFAIFCSVVLFYVSFRLTEHPSAPADPSLFLPFAGLSLTSAVMSFVIPRLMQRGANAFGLETREVPGVVTPDSPNATKRVFTDPDKARLKAWQLFQTKLTLSLALSETPALFGYFLGFTGFSEERILPFFVASLVLIAVRFPTANAAEKMLEGSAGASF